MRRGWAPEPGPYGPVPWSEPRPRTLWVCLGLWLVSGVFYAVFIWEGGSNVLGWVFPAAVLYFLWRGSKIAWWISIVYALIGIAASLGPALEAGGTESVVHIIEGAFLTAMVVFLVLPPSRRFFDLRTRSLSTRDATQHG